MKPPQVPVRALTSRVIHAGRSPDPSAGGVITPIYQTSACVQAGSRKHKGYEYSRTQDPTWFACERCAPAFASGMAMIAMVPKPHDSGSHLITMDDLCDGSYRPFERVRQHVA
jgi:cystathionine gamma-lyase